MDEQEWKDFITCPKEVSDKIIAYYGLANPGTYIYHGERIYDKKTKKHNYLITWPSLSFILKDWDEDGVDLYTILDRVSCWSCANKNKKELTNIKKYLPKYWKKFKTCKAKFQSL